MSKLVLNGKTFHLSPHIGHCLELKNRGIDLLGVDQDPQIEKLVSNPIAFLEVLEVLLSESTDDDSFRMPALASHMRDGQWQKARVAVLDSFRDFFRENGYPQIAIAIEQMQYAAETVTQKVAQSLETGPLKAKLDKIIDEAMEELTAID